MCGITGIINLDKKPIDKENLVQMTRALKHRGPDDEGFFIQKNVGLGHRRLSIIDLSKTGHQPMFYDNRNLVIVYNGEIYNYLEIKQELIGLGYRFHSQSDTEVILASYREWGEQCLKKFNGMWALVIYDRRKNILFAARDRLGVKPFYYLIDKNRFVFASEIKAILTLPGFKAKANEKIVWEYVIGGLLDHSEETFFQGVKELRRAHYLTLKIDTCKLKIEKYWDLDLDKVTHFQDESEYAARFRQLMTDSVRLRLRSDVPIGSCLSGGLDSSLIVCIVNDLLRKGYVANGDRPIPPQAGFRGKIESIGRWQQTFSAAYDRAKYKNCDERTFINQVIKKTHARPHFIFPKVKDLTREIEKLTYHQDAPFGSTSIYAQWSVFRLASKNHLKVMLDGQGADELLCGYHGFFNVYFAELFRELKFASLLSELYYYSKNHFESINEPIKALVKGAVRGYLGKYVSRFVKRTLPENEVFSPAFREKYLYPAIPRLTPNPLRNMLYNQIDYSLSTLLRYEDRNSMAFSIESRVPFLDYRLVEYIFSLADNQKIRHGTTKWVMRSSSKGLLPEKIRRRQDKIGFATPEDVWIKKDLKDEMRKVFASESFESRGFYDQQKTLEKFDEYLAGKIKNYSIFWRLYNLEIWYRIFIDTSTGLSINPERSRRID